VRVPRGHRIVDEGEKTSYIWLVFSGKVNAMVNVSQRPLILTTLKKGQIFAIESALDGLPSDCSYKAASSEVNLLRIGQKHFVKHLQACNLDALRAEMILHKNWLRQ